MDRKWFSLFNKIRTSPCFKSIDFLQLSSENARKNQGVQ